MLTPGDIAAINPNTKTAPLFRYARDADVMATIHRNAGVLVNETLPEGDPARDPWRAGFLRMFDMANDSGLFHDQTTAAAHGVELDGNEFVWPDGNRALPLYEGKMVRFYDHRFGTYEGQTQKQANEGVLPRTASSVKDKPTLPSPCALLD